MMRLLVRSGSFFGLLMAFSGFPAAWGQDSAEADTVDLVAPVPVAGMAPGGTFVPLTAHERFHGFLHETILGTRPALQIAGTAFMEHLGHQPVEWGLGVRGYSRRLRNRIYSNLIDGGVHYSMAALLRQDTRYLPARTGSAGHRLGHALKRTVLTYNQSGGRVVDVSGLSGIYAGTMLPMFWHPHGYSPLAQGVRAGNFGVMFQAGSNVIQEFRPDFERLFSKKSQN